MRNGILNIYKEKGYTSHDVVAKLRGIVRQKRIGHTGTLDPDAEGVLPVCLGKVTDTQDLTGRVLEEREAQGLTEEEVRSCIAGFAGDYEQLPPMYSALKVNGKKLYELARQGIEVERKKRKVRIHEISIQEISLPRVRMKVHCSKGTYIRTLCHDIGRKLGCGGCMESLLRIRAGCFELSDSVRLGDVEAACTAGNLDKILRPADWVFEHLRAVEILEPYRNLAYNGNPFSLRQMEEIQKAGEQKPEEDQASRMESGDGESRFSEGEQVRVYDAKGRFIGIYRYHGGRQEFRVEKMFLDREAAED